MTRTEILLLLLIGLIACVAYGQDRCKSIADWAVQIFMEHKAGIIVNVMPRDQALLDLVKTHQGTADELHKKIVNECSGTRI